jgi:hypothetical protein
VRGKTQIHILVIPALPVIPAKAGIHLLSQATTNFSKKQKNPTNAQTQPNVVTIPPKPLQTQTTLKPNPTSLQSQPSRYKPNQLSKPNNRLKPLPTLTNKNNRQKK